jgi:hypothetical protein
MDGDDAGLARDVSYETLRLGMVGAVFLYHFAEVASERGALPAAGSKMDAWQLISNATISPNEAALRFILLTVTYSIIKTL